MTANGGVGRDEAAEVERRARVARGWDEVAEGYDAYFVPRFAPWLRAGVDAITDGVLPDGPILVPCCGTFPEVEPLIERFPDRELVGIDLSAGMVRLARSRVEGHPQVSVVEGDAATLDPQWSGRCGAVVSVFGLQQLPDPEQAVRSWLAVLRPGGRLSVVYWPSKTEDDGPFAVMADVVRAQVPAGDSSWEGRLAIALVDAGGVVLRDAELSFPMTHADAATYFDAANRAGSLRALGIARGDEFMARLRDEFLEKAPTGEWTHHPRARILVVQR
ncbi:class I SAM-dependent methyltransferase [Kribbella caucasensis]|nr:class I SAM-dependent methyltransferase [Kribbella sp. VKM Ac-2527]